MDPQQSSTSLSIILLTLVNLPTERPLCQVRVREQHETQSSPLLYKVTVRLRLEGRFEGLLPRLSKAGQSWRRQASRVSWLSQGDGGKARGRRLGPQSRCDLDLCSTARRLVWVHTAPLAMNLTLVMGCAAWEKGSKSLVDPQVSRLLLPFLITPVFINFLVRKHLDRRQLLAGRTHSESPCWQGKQSGGSREAAASTTTRKQRQRGLRLRGGYTFSKP